MQIFPSRRQHGCDAVAGLPWCNPGPCRRPYLPNLRFALHYKAEHYRRPASTVQSRTSCQRPGTGLPLLSLVGRKGALCGAAAHRNLHDLPFPDLDKCRDAGAGAGELGRRPAYSMAARQPTSGLCLLRPFRPYRQGRWLYDLPWTDPADEADPPGGAFDHAVVPELPPRPRQIHSTARSGIRHRMDCSCRR